MIRVVLGNRHATDSTDNGKTRTALPKGKRATVIEIDEATPLTSALVAITAAGGVWATQTAVTDDEGAVVEPKTPPAPAWVASSDAALASVLAAHWGGIEIRDLEEPA